MPSVVQISRLEDAVVEWINRAAFEPNVEALPDGEMLKLGSLLGDLAADRQQTGLLARRTITYNLSVRSGAQCSWG